MEKAESVTKYTSAASLYSIRLEEGFSGSFRLRSDHNSDWILIVITFTHRVAAVDAHKDSYRHHKHGHRKPLPLKAGGILLGHIQIGFGEARGDPF